MEKWWRVVGGCGRYYECLEDFAIRLKVKKAHRSLLG